MPSPLFTKGLPRSNPLANNTSHSSSFVIQCHWRCSIPSHAISSSNILLCSQALHCPWGIALCSSHSIIQVLIQVLFLSHFQCSHRTRLFCVTSFTDTLVLSFSNAPLLIWNVFTNKMKGKSFRPWIFLSRSSAIFCLLIFSPSWCCAVQRGICWSKIRVGRMCNDHSSYRVDRVPIDFHEYICVDT